ncbi:MULTISPECIES: ArsR/SmtB family transcription factor [Tissierellales]|jgi:DNA-binding transcriptional ArsR family regulator|uniref:Transcriptional regulator n=1 Tax=Acidilutibacter cellobiosedens TaxID=2507161 RepID=A0A410Q881_9FIRM|nr:MULTISPECIES: metalloregulator ArsR/SmtB family transcription factor [Tissierellales]MBE6083290.1 helix-turn-helix transcriptional regulator [Tissierellaceae bacterium]QAT60191.1 transcriptional regulator [Acidilutibacter cellobiosedens]SCL92558.1 putative HTH-type transcriptional regulator YgaV [Sporanaerobacter sp. PP17-6a]
MENKAKQIAELLKVLANENRLLILCELIKGPKNVSSLGEKIPNITQSALSQHLALLKSHGILDFSKSGQSVTYYISDHRVEEVIFVLKKYYCNSEKDKG